MVKFLIIFLLSFFSLLITQDSSNIKVVNYDKIVSLIESKDTKIKVFNFWATWCGPCIAELPFFSLLSQDSQMHNYDFYYISVNSIKEVKSVHTFLKKQKIKTHSSYLINNVNFNEWIDKIDPRWTGSIPMTLIVFPDGKKILTEQEFESVDELKKFLTQNI